MLTRSATVMRTRAAGHRLTHLPLRPLSLSSNSSIDFSPEVREALENKRPVVALESTIISHGMPYPQNLEVAIEAEAIFRANNVTPATIAILDGRIQIGLSPDKLEFLAKTGKNVQKVSRRDVAGILSKRGNGATTVATTMMFASMADIPIFVTGGLGGVHRDMDASNPAWDVSADLEEFAKSNVAVVCAGVKSILDFPRTLEYLETQGCPVVGYKTDHFPSFFTRETNPPLQLACSAPDAREMAGIVKQQIEIVKAGMVICNPIPVQNECVGVDAGIEQALQEAEQAGVKGKDITPFLLAKLNEITEGRSLESNIALFYNNCKSGCEIAVELNKLNTGFYDRQSGAEE